VRCERATSDSVPHQVFNQEVRLNMKLHLYALAGALLSAIGIAQAEPFPAPHSGSTLTEIEQSFDAWHGKPIAFPGRILRMEEGYEGRPLLRILLPRPNPEQREIWVSSQVPTDTRQFAIGDVVIVYGRLERAKEDDPVTTPVYDTTYHVLGECVVNATTKRIYYAPDADERCQAWRDGVLPES
jgi:hypothetical protein